MSRLSPSVRLGVAAVAACFIASPVLSNPLNPTVVNGAASFNQAGNVLTVTNSNGAIINWDRFSIKAGETTHFAQTAASSTVLNRVLSDPTAIYGTLSSNGRVWLVNPAGIMVGPGGRVDVAGFVASTLNIRNEDFLAGRSVFINDGSARNVINQGEIRTPAGGGVYLIGSNVTNEGIIITPQGETILAAGVTVSLIDSATPGVKVDITGAEGNATNLGTITAEAGRIGIAGVIVRNSGTLNASSVVNEGGRVFLRATKAVILESGSEIKADAGLNGKGGNVLAWGDETASIDGAISARGGSQFGNGGVVETSAAQVNIAATARVNTLAPGGKAGIWVIDPTDYTIAVVDPLNGSSYMSNATLSTNLGGGDIIIQTLASGTGNGDIFINDAVAWSANTTLTLSAYRSIDINANVTATGNTAGLVLTPGTGGSGDYNINSGSKITLSGSTPSLTIAGQAYTVINDVNALQAMNNNLAGYYALGSDIDAIATSGWNGGAGFVPIGVATSWSSIPGASSVEDILVVLASNWAGNTHFANRFSGLGHAVSNLSINRPASNSVGLFGSAGPNATIRDVGLANVDIVGNTYIGGLVGWNYGLIKNSSVSGSMTTGSTPNTGSNNMYVGGLIGYNWGHVRNSWTSGSVTGSVQYVGGLIGLNEGYISASLGALGSVSHSYSSANVSGNGGHFGGLIGNNWGVVSNSYASGNVTGVSGSLYLGGLIGSNWNNVNNSYATGHVSSGTSSQFVGSLMGDNQNSLTTVSNSYASGTISVGAGSTSIGGLVGHNTGTFANSYWDTQTTGQGTSAGGTGMTTAELMTQATYSGWDFTNTWWMSESNTRPLLRAEYSTNITNAHQLQLMALNLGASYELANDINMAELTQASGVWNTNKGFLPIGAYYNYDGPRFTGALDGRNHIVAGLAVNRPERLGVGLIGAMESSAVVKNIGVVSVDLKGLGYVGGLVGYNQGGSVDNSFSDGVVSGIPHPNSSTWDVGGLVGLNYFGTISKSHSSATVSVGVGGYDVGGLVGANYGNISDSYATGNVVGNSSMTSNEISQNIGGLVGASGDFNNWNSNSATISNSFSTGTVTGAGGRGAHNVGGLVGYLIGTTTNSYSTSTVSVEGQSAITDGTQNQNIGGLVGVAGYNFSISNAYSSGSITSAANSVFVGGLIGRIQATGSGSATSSYWDTQTSGQSISASGSGLTTVQMKSLASYSGWNISSSAGSGTIWRIYEGDTAPLLRSYLTPQNVTAVTADTKIYDGGGYSGGNGYTSAAADPAKILYGGSSQGARNVGSYTIRLYSDQLGYDLSGVLSNTLTISPADLTLTTANVTKTYDGGTSASGLAMVKIDSGTQLFSTDSLTGGSFAFTDPNAGTGNKTVTVAGVTVTDGNSGNNYTVSYANNTTSTIDKASLAATAYATSKTYDGLAYSGGNGVSYTGFVNGEDSGVLGGTLAYGGSSQGAKNAGSYAITPSGLTSGNYTITFNNGTLTIQQRPLTVTSLSGSKIYDGSTELVNPSYTSDKLSADSVSLLGAFNFDTKNIGTGKSLTGTSLGLTGADAENYSLATATLSGSGAITVRPIGIMADDKEKLVQTPDPALTYRIGGMGLVTGDSLTGSLTRESGEAIGAYPILQGTLVASSNYAITDYLGATLTIIWPSNNADSGRISAVNTASGNLITASENAVNHSPVIEPVGSDLRPADERPPESFDGGDSSRSDERSGPSGDEDVTLNDLGKKKRSRKPGEVIAVIK